MVNEFRYLRAHAVQPLAKFLDYITCALCSLSFLLLCLML